MLQTLLVYIKKIPRQYLIPLVMALFGIIFFGYGLIQYFGHTQSSSEEMFTSNVAVSPSVKTVKNISVDVEGAVFHTGVFTVPENSRVEDALIKTGGLNQD